MANVKVTALSSLAAGDSAATDVLPIVDVSADATKKLAISDLHRSVPDGTLSAPGIAFQSDLNSGLYRSGTDAIALVTNGAARILVDATGNVTIPNNLTVEGTTTFIDSQTLRIEDKNIELGVVSTPTDVTADGGGITLKGTTDKTIKWISSTNAWTFNKKIIVQASSSTVYAELATGASALGELVNLTAGSTATQNVSLNLRPSNGGTETQGISIRHDGKVGIGTEEPSVNLHVAGTEPQVYIQDSNSTGNNVNATIQFRDSSNAQQGYLGFASTGNTDLYLTNAASNGALQLGTGNTTRLTITSTGNAEFGGNVSANDGILVDGGSTLSTGIYYRDDSNSYGLALYSGGSAQSNRKVFIKTDGSATFQGNVGIKTTTPDGTLHVHTGTAGTVTANSGADDLVVENSGDCGISLLTADGNNTTALFFGCPTQTVGAAIRYNHNSSEMSLGPDQPGAHLRINSGDGAAAMYIDSDGNINIGTSTAATNAEVTIRAAAPQLSLYATPGNVSRVTFGDTDDWNIGQIYYDNNTNKLYLYTNNDDRMVIDSSGRVLINNTNADQAHPLQVTASAGTAEAIVINARASDNIGELSFFRNDRTTRQGEIQYRNDHVNFRHRSGDICFAAGGVTESMRIDSSGRLVIGHTAAVSGSPATNSLLQIRGRKDAPTDLGQITIARGNTAVNLGVNADLGKIHFTDSDGDIFASIAANVDAASGGASGNPGRLSFWTEDAGSDNGPSERMRIDRRGYVGIGTTNPTRHLEIGGSVVISSGSRLESSSSGGSLIVQGGSTYPGGHLHLYGGSSGNDKIEFCTTGASDTNVDVRMVMDTGHFVIGGETITENDQANFDMSGTLTVRRANGTDYCFIGRTGSTPKSSILANGKFSSIGAGLTGGAGNFAFQATHNAVGSDGPYAAMGTSNNEAVITGGYIGTGDTALVFHTSDGGTEGERMRITSDGESYFGITTTQIDQSSGSGGHFIGKPGGYVGFARANDPVMYVNRIGGDGTLITLRHAGTTEGTISSSGSTISYNGGHISRWSQLANGAARTEILRGSVLSNLDEMCEWGEENNEQLNRMKVSDVEGDRNVSGVFQSWDDDDDTYTNDFYCAMTGDFVIRIAQGTTVERGDLLMSAGDGTAKPQDDDIIRSKTIAKVTSTTVSVTYSDGSYCVPCVLMAC